MIRLFDDPWLLQDALFFSVSASGSYFNHWNTQGMVAFPDEKFIGVVKIPAVIEREQNWTVFKDIYTAYQLVMWL